MKATSSQVPPAGQPLRYLFVHAHPDDETLATGVALATLARAGHDVHVLTATLGEEGEVIPPRLRHLASDADDALGPYRRGELRAAMAHLGVHEHVLGEDGAARTGSVYRDSGMADTPANADARSWLGADEEAGTAAIGAELRRVRPDVIVTYDEHGGYLHPDHVTTHRRTRAAVAALPPPARPALYVVLIPADEAAADRAWLPEHVDPAHGLSLRAADEPYPPSVVDPGLITHRLAGGPDDLRARDAALREHETQVSVFDGYYALSNDIAARLSRSEWFARIDPDTGALLPRESADVVDGLPAPSRGRLA